MADPLKRQPVQHALKFAQEDTSQYPQTSGTSLIAMEPYLIVLEPSATGCAAFSPDVPGCVATGASVEQTLTEMRAALAFHFEGMAEAGESLPLPKGLEHHVRNGEPLAEAGDLLTTIPAQELLAVGSASVPTA